MSGRFSCPQVNAETFSKTFIFTEPKRSLRVDERQKRIEKPHFSEIRVYAWTWPNKANKY